MNEEQQAYIRKGRRDAVSENLTVGSARKSAEMIWEDRQR